MSDDIHENVQDVEHWRISDRHLQGLGTVRQRRAQAVVDVGESAKHRADRRGTSPIDDLLDLYLRVRSTGARKMVGDAMGYVKAELDLVKPVRSGGIAFDELSDWPRGDQTR